MNIANNGFKSICISPYICPWGLYGDYSTVYPEYLPLCALRTDLPRENIKFIRPMHPLRALNSVKGAGNMT